MGATANTNTDLSPSPWWGGVRGGGKPSVYCFASAHYLSAIPPTLSLPHKGRGDDGGAAIRLPCGTLGPGSRAGRGAVRSRSRVGPCLPGMTRGAGGDAHTYQFASPDGACERADPGSSHLVLTLVRLVFLGGRSVRSVAGKIPDGPASRRRRERGASGNARDRECRSSDCALKRRVLRCPSA